MLDGLVSMIAPHYCCGCDKIGSLICSDCKNNIIYDRPIFCMVCCRPTMDMSLCPDCVGVISKAWAVGERNSVIQRVIGDFKFQRMRSAYRDLGDLLNGVLPVLPDNTVIVPIPTTNPHIRERGYDHMLLIAKYLAKKRRLKYQRILYRKTNTKQRQADNKQRDKQASQAFGVRNFNLDSSIPYLIIDDVYTTGATVKYAAKELKKAGAKIIWVAVIAKQVNT